jgi:hypothetical protein
MSAKGVVMTSVAAWGRRMMLGLFLVFLASWEAFAAPIGIFSFDVNVDPNLGPFFTVENVSDPGAPFVDITIQLFDDVTPIHDLSLDDIDPFGIAQTLSDLRLFSFDSAVLRFGFLSSTQVVPLAGLSFSCDANECTSPAGGPISSFIEYTSPDPGPEPVPEPSTLLLVTSGFAAAWRVRSRRRRSHTSAL